MPLPHPIRTAPGVIILCSLLACTPSTPAGPSSQPAPVEDPPKAAFDDPGVHREDPETRVEPRGKPPIEGLEYWADAPLTTKTFLAHAETAGIEIEHTVEVSNVPDLLRALAPNTAIVLAPGRHEFIDSNIVGRPEDQAGLPDWSKLSKYYDDGEIHDLHDLVILGPGPEPTVLLQKDGYAHTLSFRNVRDLGLHNLTLGHHPEQGWCMGGVVKVVDSRNVLIADSTLFGSGTQGLSLVSVDGLRLVDSVITNCSEQFSTFSQSRGISFERVRVAGNKSDLLRGFAIYRSVFTLSDSNIANNKPLGWDSPDSYNLLFAVDGSFDWGTWFVDEPRVLEPDRRRSQVILRNTVIDGERFDRQL